MLNGRGSLVVEEKRKKGSVKKEPLIFPPQPNPFAQPPRDSTPLLTHTAPVVVINPKIKLSMKGKRSRTMFNEKAEELTDKMFNFDGTPFRMTLNEAVEKAGFPEAKDMMEACDEKIRQIRCAWEGHLTVDDIKSILIYTYELDDDTIDSPYKIVNSKLSKRSIDGLRKIRGYVLYLLRALRKLPRFNSRCILYRGIWGENVSTDKYKEGSSITWSSFTSTTTDEDVASNFADGSEVPLLFIIRGNYIGYSLMDYSFRETEKGTISCILLL